MDANHQAPIARLRTQGVIILKTLAACALSLAFAIPTATLAAPADVSEGAARAVRHADLNLATQRDARLMLQRLENAAADVCGASSFVSLAHKRAVRDSACYRESMSRALEALASPTVNALYRAPAISVASN